MLADRLSAHFGVDMSDASLRKAIDEWNAFAEVVRSIGDLRKRTDPPITGTEFHTLLMASLVSPKDLIMPDLIEFRRKLEERQGINDYRARLMVVGGHLHDPEFIKAIESQGGDCGGRPFLHRHHSGIQTRAGQWRPHQVPGRAYL